MKNQLGKEIEEIKGVKKIIAIASAKGGVGKSTISVNLALALKKLGNNIALVDADIYGPSIGSLMNLREKPVVKDGLFEPIISYGVKTMSISSIIDESSAGVWRGPMVTKILFQLMKAVNWNFDKKDVDFMIIDMPPGTGDVYLSVAEKFPLLGVIIISTPQELSIIDVVRSIDCFKKLKIPIIGLVQNMSFLEINGEKNYIFGRDSVKDLAKKYGLNFLADLPLQPKINQLKTPLLLDSPDCNESLEIMKIANIICNL